MQAQGTLADPGRHLLLPGQTPNDRLTTPSQAAPVPTVMAVGMSPNFPAWERPGLSLSGHDCLPSLIQAYLSAPVPWSDPYLPSNEDIEADSIQLEQAACLHT
jgi:hypothetical protein